ncbi:MAG TPA: LysR substrate-binding domain-containing protein [Candidatus Paceibacterota bacterium]|nr:LysR substrate-binding domain-containing protein [Candidatus Paceibacterota bacterium]
MELRHLRYFVAVAETENVSRAALKLHVSQPALSRQIRDLEDELGFQLLERTAKSVSLTEAGRVFLKEACALLKQTENAVEKARSVANGSTELHVGYSPTPTARILPPTLRAFQAVMPNVRVKLHDLSNYENLLGLREGTLQLAFVVRPRKASALNKLKFEELSRDPMRLAVSPNHPLARRGVVSLADAAREPFVVYSRKDYPDYHDSLAVIFAGIKGKLRIVEEHDGVSSLIPAVEAGAGVAMVPQSLSCVVGNRLKLLRITPEPAPLILGIASLPTKLTVAAETFWQCARKSGPELSD